MGKLVKLFGVALLVVILIKVDLREIGSILARCGIGHVAAGFGLSVVAIGIKAARWWLMLRQQHLAYSWPKAFRTYLAGLYLGVVTPGRLGELGRAAYVKRDTGASVGTALSSILLDRVLDLYALTAIGLVACWVFDLFGRTSPLFLAAAGAVLLLPAAALHPRIGARVVGVVEALLARTKLGAAVGSASGDFYAGIRQLISPWLVVQVALTAAAYATLFAAAFLIARGLSIDISLPDTGLVFGLANMISLIPLTVAGVGTRDAVFILVFGVRGLPPSQAVAFSTLVLAVFYLGDGLVGALSFLLDRSAAVAAPRR